MPKIRAENPKPKSRAKKGRISSEINVNTSPPVEIPETSSPSLLQMKSFARINQRPPKRKRRGKAAAAIAKNSPAANMAPGCAACESGIANSVTLRTTVQDDIAQSADFLTFLHESLFPDRSIKLCASPLPPRCPADRADSTLFTWSSNLAHQLPESKEAGSSFGAADSVHVEACSSRTPCPSEPAAVIYSSSATAEEVEVNHFTAAENPPSTPRGPVSFVSTCREFTLVTPPWSPPSPHEASVVAALWNNFDEISHVSTTSIRRTLKFDAVELDKPPQLQKNLDLSTELAAAHIAARVELQVPDEGVTVPQVAMDPGSPSEAGRGKALQMVPYDEGSKRMVVYRKARRVRRVRHKPKVNLDASTVKMFKTLTIKAGTGEEEADEQGKASWERARQMWKNRAHHFISIMRQVQGPNKFPISHVVEDHTLF